MDDYSIQMNVGNSSGLGEDNKSGPTASSTFSGLHRRLSSIAPDKSAAGPTEKSSIQSPPHYEQLVNADSKSINANEYGGGNSATVIPSSVIEISPATRTSEDVLASEDFATVVKNLAIQEILGAPLKGVRQFFYVVDPYKSEQFLRAPKMFEDINMYFAVIYYAGLCLFAIYSFLLYYQSVPVEVNAMVLASSLNPVWINISMTCSAPHQCGNWTKPWRELVPPTITQTWSHGENINPICKANNGQTFPFPASGSIVLPTCFSGSIFDGVFLNVPFTTQYTSKSPYASVILSGSTANYTNGMSTMVTLAPTQSKIVFFSQTVYYDLNSKAAVKPYVGDMFYNGHSTTDEGATLALQLQQFGYTSTQTRSNTIMTTLGSIGGFANVYLVICSFCRGFLVVAKKVTFNMHGETWYGGVLLGVYLFTVAVLRTIGLISQGQG